MSEEELNEQNSIERFGEPDSSRVPAAKQHLKKFLFRPGTSGNRNGRPKTKPFRRALMKRLQIRPNETFHPENELERLAAQLVDLALSTKRKARTRSSGPSRKSLTVQMVKLLLRLKN
jgi:hypothetical protein